MKYLLDTNICIYLIAQNEKIQKRLFLKKPPDIVLSSITVSELEYGVANSSKPKQNAEALSEFLSTFQILPYDQYAAKMYGTTRYALQKRGVAMGAMDLLIAVSCLSKNLILVTNDRDFSRIPHLKIENWAK